MEGDLQLYYIMPGTLILGQEFQYEKLSHTVLLTIAFI